jgi:hypothetical protein
MENIEVFSPKNEPNHPEEEELNDIMQTIR